MQLVARVEAPESKRAAAGKPPERPDPLRTNAVFSDFAKSVSTAITPAKRVALVNAAARQFDPDAGDASTRAYWFARVKALSDVQVLLIQLLGEHARMAFDSLGPVPLNVDPPARLEMPREDALALRAAAVELARPPLPALVTEGHGTYNMPDEGFTRSGENFSLTEEGKIVARRRNNWGAVGTPAGARTHLSAAERVSGGIRSHFECNRRRAPRSANKPPPCSARRPSQFPRRRSVQSRFSALRTTPAARTARIGSELIDSAALAGGEGEAIATNARELIAAVRLARADLATAKTPS
jgi:hypothetical protein